MKRAFAVLALALLVPLGLSAPQVSATSVEIQVSEKAPTPASLPAPRLDLRVSDGSTWYVNGGIGLDTNDCLSPTNGTTPAGPCQTIQKAINNANDGDTIVIAAGIYTENLKISERVTIIGAGRNGDPLSNTVITARSLGTATIVYEGGGS